MRRDGKGESHGCIFMIALLGAPLFILLVLAAGMRRVLQCFGVDSDGFTPTKDDK